MISRNVPLADQVKREIISRFDSEEFIGGERRLPSEEELSKLFGVSRSTIRSALTSLEESGIVSRRHGVGTYLNDLGIPPSSVWGWLDEASTFEDLIRSSNHTAETRIFESELRTAGSSSAPLRAEPIAPVLWLAKVFYSDTTPVIFSETSIPLELAEPEKRTLEALQEHSAKSVYRILEECFGRSVHHQTSEIRAVLADETIARTLNYAVGLPLLSLEEVGYSPEQDPLYHAIHCFRADQVSFRLIRRPVLSIASNGTEKNDPDSEGLDYEFSIR